MGCKGKELLTWGVAGNFTPFLGILERGNFAIEVVEVSDGNFAHVGADNQMIVLG